MILINVLLFVALSAAVVMLMISTQDGALHRSGRMADAARARAAALGGERSAITALRRDMLAGPDSDDRTEPWAGLAARDVPIRGGTFSLAIADAEDRANINLLMRDDPAGLLLADRILASLGLPHALAVQAAQLVRSVGPLPSIAPLGAIGLKPEVTAALATLVTALPTTGGINLNAASEPVLALLIGDPVKAKGLAALRQRRGRLVAEDLQSLQISLPPLAGFTSATFWVKTRVRVGDATQQLTTLLVRRRTKDAIAVIPVARWWGPGAPPQAPPI